METKKTSLRQYDSTFLTSKKLTDVLADAMRQIKTSYKERPLSLVEAWPEIIGASFAPFSKATRFDAGVLYVDIKNAAVMSLLANPAGKKKIIEQYRLRFPRAGLNNIVFRIG